MKKLLVSTIVFTIFLASCTTNESVIESSLISDMIDAGFVVTKGIESDKLIFHEEVSETDFFTESEGMVFDNFYTFTDNLSNDYGYIYEIQDESSMDWFFSHKSSYSYYTNDIVIIYRVDNLILEVYQSTDSSLPGFLRHYDFEASYQYNILTGETYIHPKIDSLISNATEVEYIYDENDMYENLQYNHVLDIKIHKLSKISYIFDEGYVGIDIYELSTIDESVFLFENGCYLMGFPHSAYTQQVIRYQNYIFRISSTLTPGHELVLEYLFNDIEFHSLSEIDCI